MYISVVETSNNHDFLVDGNEGYFGGELFVIETGPNGFELELDLLLFGEEIGFVVEDLEEAVLLFSENEK